MSSPDSPLLAIERSSRSHATVIVAVILILGLTPWLVPRISILVCALLMIITMTWAFFALWRAGWLGGMRTVHKAIWSADGEWHLLDAKGAKYLATLHPSSQVMGPIMWLRFSSALGVRDLLFLGRSMPADVRRQLVVRLRLQGSRDPQGSTANREAKPAVDAGVL